MTVRRLKTYAGSQGFVYQYYFVGKRPASDPNTDEYVFDVTSDRETIYAVSVILQHKALSAWAESHGRPLVGAEQFAAVKLRLFRAFDEVADMRSTGRRLLADAPFLEESLASLGVE
jgi:hypothetical protein